LVVLVVSVVPVVSVALVLVLVVSVVLVVVVDSKVSEWVLVVLLHLLLMEITRPDNNKSNQPIQLPMILMLLLPDLNHLFL
jgi:hypothetical protein